MRHEQTGHRLLLFSGSLLLIAFTLSPFVWMLWISLADRPDFLVTGQVAYSFSHYRDVLSAASLHFLEYFRNSLIVSFIVAFSVTLFSSLAAYAVSRLSFPGRSFIPIAILAMSMFPQIALVGYLFELLATFGLINTYGALVFPYIAWTIPIALWVNLSYFSQIPRELDQAALVDGASRWVILWHIILPLALPGVFSSCLLVFIACFNEFLFALMFTIDTTAQTLPVGLALFEGLHGEIPWGSLMAASTIATLPLVILTLVFQRYIVQGLMGGAVKG